ncbi:MAG: hypothetical protein Q4A56_00505 [Porphyromonadaceae bacterium]|nr:hypothetical protein [Porphyromonadaceae bacterium]
MKKVLLLTLIIGLSISALAQTTSDIESNLQTESPTRKSWWSISNLNKGYKGFVDIGSGFYYIPDIIPSFNLSTSHGYQISPHNFVGLGINFELLTGYNLYYNKFVTATIMNPFIQYKWTNIAKRITPFLDFKGGYVLSKNLVSFNPSVGARLGLGRKFGINVGVAFPMLIKIGDGLLFGTSFLVGIDF